MASQTDYRNPTGFMVFNTRNGGWKVYTQEGEALALTRRWSQLRMFPIYGQPEIDQKFIDFARWAVAA